jgi:hypothetical protein
MKKLSITKEYLQVIILGILLVLIFLPSLYQEIYVFDWNDYGLHISFAQSLEAGEEIPAFSFAHPFWQLIVILVHKAASISFQKSAIIVQLVAYFFLAVIIYRLLGSELKGYLRKLSIPLSIAMMIATPVFLFVSMDKLYYLGYVGISSYHNPTINLLKPFALLIFFYGVIAIDGRSKTVLHIAIAASLTAISALIKPSFVICLLPALGLVVLYEILKKQPVNWRILILGICLPAVIVLTWQYYIAYISDEPAVLFAPFEVMRSYSDFLLPKFLLSILFPLLVTIVYYKDAIKDRQMHLAWLTFFFGAIYTYFFAEGGSRFQHGNFGWSGEIALFVLFVISTIFFFKSKSSQEQFSRKDKLILAFGFSPHIIAGIIYYVHCLLENTFI